MGLSQRSPGIGRTTADEMGDDATARATAAGIRCSVDNRIGYLAHAPDGAAVRRNRDRFLCAVNAVLVESAACVTTQPRLPVAKS